LGLPKRELIQWWDKDDLWAKGQTDNFKLKVHFEDKKWGL